MPFEYDATTRARIVGEVCGRIAAGESVDQCFATPGVGYCGEATFWRWIGTEKDLLAMYETAIAARGLYFGERVSTFARADPERIDTAFGQRIDPGWVQLQKLRSDDAKWIAARMAPRRYGDRTIIAGDADAPLEHHHTAALVASKLLQPSAAGDAEETLGDDDGSGVSGA